jgi:hypothetical protein
LFTSKIKSFYRPALLTKQIEPQDANALEKPIEFSDASSITIGEEPNLKLKIDIKRSGKKDYLAYLNFTDNLHFSYENDKDKGEPMDVLDLLDDTQESKVLALVQQYKDSLNNLSEVIKKQQQQQHKQKQEVQRQRQREQGRSSKINLSKDRWAIIAKPLYISKGLQVVKKRLKMLESLQSINICTLSSKGEVIAITKIELDGDIMTVVSSRFDDNRIIKRHLLSIHNCNVRYANELFLQQIKALQHNMRVLHNLIRASSFSPVGVSLASSLPIWLGLPLPFVTPFIFAGAIPATILLNKYNGRIIFKLAPKAIGVYSKFKNLKRKR